MCAWASLDQTRPEPSAPSRPSAGWASRLVTRIFAYGTRPDRLVRFGLWVIAACVVAFAWAWNLSAYTVGVDLEIPLRAAERWVAGGQPYLGSAFTNLGGATQPFMYPPYALPILAPLTLLPRAVVLVPWLGLLLVVAFATCRRLGVPRPVDPGGAGLAAVCRAPHRRQRPGSALRCVRRVVLVTGWSWRSPRHRRRSRAGLAYWAQGWGDHVPEGRPVPALAPRRPLAVEGSDGRSCVVGGAALVTLPLVGLDTWRDWLEQLVRATNLDWGLGGFALPRMLPGIGLAVSAMACLGVLFVRSRDAGRTVGILTVIGAPSLYTFGLLFLLPAMLHIRREVSLVAASLVATYTYAGDWAAIVLVAVALAAASRRPVLREPVGQGWALGPPANRPGGGQRPMQAAP